MICVKKPIGIDLYSVLMIVFRKYFITCSCDVDKNRAAVVLNESLRFCKMKPPKVGDRVQTTAAVVMGKKLAIQRYGANAKVKKISGEIIVSEGSGRGANGGHAGTMSKSANPFTVLRYWRMLGLLRRSNMM